jgi:hypothetical protein
VQARNREYARRGCNHAANAAMPTARWAAARAPSTPGTVEASTFAPRPGYDLPEPASFCLTEDIFTGAAAIDGATIDGAMEKR